MVSEPVLAAIIAAVVTLFLSALASAVRYVFGVRLVTTDRVDEKIATANRQRQTDFDAIIERLDEHGEKLSEIESLIMGGEYQVSDGMLEIVEANRDVSEDHESRIKGVERIQLKIRRRQREHSGGEPVARGEDVDPPPSMGTETDEEELDE